MIRRSLLLLAAVAILGGCTQDGITGITVVTDGSHTIETGSRVLGTVAVGSGSLMVEEGAAVEGDVFVGDGVLTVAGSVSGNITAIGGTVNLAPTGHVRGTVQIGAGGALVQSIGSRVDGGVERGVAVSAAAGPPHAPLEAAAWTAARSAVLLILLAAIRQLAPGRVAAAGGYLSRMPAASAAYGFLVGLVGVSLFVLMAFTIILIPVSLVGLAALGLGAALGLAAALDALAGRVGMFAASTTLIVTAAVLPSLPGIGAILVTGSLVTALGATALSLQRPQRR
jgi:cytoskeletal protein CcmA (bactofilin family)